MSTSRGHISRLKFSAVANRAQQMTTPEPCTRTEMSLHSRFEQFATCASSRGEPLLYWSQWPEFVQSVSPLLCAPSKWIHDKTKGQQALADLVVKYFGSHSMDKPVAMPLQHGSGRRAASAVSFADAHSIFWECLLVQPIDAYLKRVGLRSMSARSCLHPSRKRCMRCALLV